MDRQILPTRLLSFNHALDGIFTIPATRGGCSRRGQAALRRRSSSFAGASSARQLANGSRSCNAAGKRSPRPTTCRAHPGYADGIFVRLSTVAACLEVDRRRRRSASKKELDREPAAEARPQNSASRQVPTAWFQDFARPQQGPRVRPVVQGRACLQTRRDRLPVVLGASPPSAHRHPRPTSPWQADAERQRQGHDRPFRARTRRNRPWTNAHLHDVDGAGRAATSAPSQCPTSSPGLLPP